MNKKTSKKSSEPHPEEVAPPCQVDQLDQSIIIPEVLPPEEYIPTTFELELVEKNRKEVALAQSGESKAELQAKQEGREQKKAFQVWYRQHLSGLFKAEQVDTAVAKACGYEVGTIRRWKIMFGWAKRLDNLKKEEKAEEKVLLYAKNEAIEHESLNQLLRYLSHVQSLAPADLLPGHISMMMKLVDFAQKNKDKMDPPETVMSASGVSLTIHQE